MQHMTNWEYMFIHLSVEAPTTIEGFENFYSEVGRAGADGWEAVREIRVDVQAEIREGSIAPTARLLMLKRPLS
jgi:hypothetical protein